MTGEENLFSQSEQSELHCGNEQFQNSKGKSKDSFLMVVYLNAGPLLDRIFLLISLTSKNFFSFRDLM